MIININPRLISQNFCRWVRSRHEQKMAQEVEAVEAEDDDERRHKDLVQVLLIHAGKDGTAQAATEDGADHHERHDARHDIGEMRRHAHRHNIGELGTEDDA